MNIPDLKPIQDRIEDALNAIDEHMRNFRSVMGEYDTLNEIQEASRLFEEIKDYADEAQEQLNDFVQDYQEAIAPSEISPQAPPHLQAMTVAQLREMLKARGVQGYSGRTKAELIRLLQGSR